MIRLGIAYNVIDDKTIQIKDLEDEELYEVKGSILDVDSIRDGLDNDMKRELLIEYNDETMEMVV